MERYAKCMEYRGNVMYLALIVWYAGLLCCLLPWVCSCIVGVNGPSRWCAFPWCVCLSVFSMYRYMWLDCTPVGIDFLVRNSWIEGARLASVGTKHNKVATLIYSVQVVEVYDMARSVTWMSQQLARWEVCINYSTFSWHSFYCLGCWLFWRSY